MSPSQRPLNEKPFLYAMSLIEGKWKLHILFWLCREGTLRYGELKRALPGITHKMLSAQQERAFTVGQDLVCACFYLV